MRVRLLNNQGNDEADQGQSLSEGSAHDEDGERAALDFGLARHRVGAAICCEADCEARTDNTEAVTDNSHDSSFSWMHPLCM